MSDTYFFKCICESTYIAYLIYELFPVYCKLNYNHN